MILLLLSIICSTSIYVLFKLFKKYGIDTLQAIVINYFVAAAFGLWFLGPSAENFQSLLQAPWLIWAAVVGILFISLFYVMALVSQQFGITVTSIASKMSLLIPVVILIAIDPDEGLSITKAAGVLTGVVAVILASAKGGTKAAEGASVLLPIVLFAGSGGLDFLLAMVQKNFLVSDLQYRQFVPVPFLVAAILGSIALVLRSRKTKIPFTKVNFAGGIALGLVNYGSIYFVLKVIGSGIMDRSSAIPANNIGIVLLSALVGLLFFRERLTAKNVVGVALASISIFILTYFAS